MGSRCCCLHLVQGSEFKVQGSGCGVQGLGFGGLGFGVWGSRVWGLGVRGQGWGVAGFLRGAWSTAG